MEHPQTPFGRKTSKKTMAPRQLFSNKKKKQKPKQIGKEKALQRTATADYLNLLSELNARTGALNIAEEYLPKNLYYRDHLEPKVSSSMILRVQQALIARTRSQTARRPLFTGLVSKRKNDKKGILHDEIKEDFDHFLKKLQFAKRVDEKAQLMVAHLKKTRSIETVRSTKAKKIAMPKKTQSTKDLFATPVNKKTFTTLEDLQREADETYEWNIAMKIVKKTHHFK